MHYKSSSQVEAEKERIDKLYESGQKEQAVTDLLTLLDNVVDDCTEKVEQRQNQIDKIDALLAGFHHRPPKTRIGKRFRLWQLGFFTDTRERYLTQIKRIETIREKFRGDAIGIRVLRFLNEMIADCEKREQATTTATAPDA